MQFHTVASREKEEQFLNHWSYILY